MEKSYKQRKSYLVEFFYKIYYNKIILLVILINSKNTWKKFNNYIILTTRKEVSRKE